MFDKNEKKIYGKSKKLYLDCQWILSLRYGIHLISKYKLVYVYFSAEKQHNNNKHISIDVCA